MRWNLKELCEDALVSYLRAVIPPDIRVAARMMDDTPTYPGVVVHAHTALPVAENAEWHDARTLGLRVLVFTERTPQRGPGDVVIASARDRHAQVVSMVCDALYRRDLLQLVIDRGISGLALSMMQFDSDTNGVQQEIMVTTIAGEAIAEPVIE